MISPYLNKDQVKWSKITEKLVAKHPLSVNEIKEIVLESWEEIFSSKIGKKSFRIGKDIFPKPQIMGFLLHELIPLEFSVRYPNIWRKEKSSSDKDLIYVPDDSFSIEIKTSSNPNSIFGNRSYAQEVLNGKKSKSGYYLAINFEKCDDSSCPKPRILKIRFGWLDHEDWMGQTAATGQQARLSPAVEKAKLLEIYSVK
ncbi:MAG: restriction endonuclease [Candidatus Magasanikbacteria bacterium RIFOXYD2_FULL_39_9]|uniref:Restriction endonuclease n=1 Tax=Candidatus Magasanikbacteria bacterium RIFOXYD1_FULL_40_23 TaxID=1798705 RepID=A0A1F6P7C5_9BACT|nr:MAG: restriction endonuclease [Candidatus Magasanikbacteria bacterium RIFOXYD2_FULL_39_9]OGH92072.1 MAG: restriction endonuclease [Candidatus Magasanikbacteria bacterium RIFOXYD1_FULL_40_23]